MSLFKIAPVLILYLFFSGFILHAQNPVATFMFYNLENLYDNEDDTLKSDNEFLPESDRRWSQSRLYAKLLHTSRVMVNTGLWEPPAVIGLCEVENRKVLERLVSMEALKAWKYRIIHKDSPDDRGIDVAALYREDMFQPLSYRYFSPAGENEKIPETREILSVTGVLAEADTIHLFFNHWPSRYGGMMETRAERKEAALRLRKEIEKLETAGHCPAVVVMGDFNDQPWDESIRRHLGASPDVSSNACSLYNLSARWKGHGTLKFRSQWFIFDQIIVNGRFLNSRNRLFVKPEEARIMDAPFLLEEDETYTGKKLNRTYTGFQYHGGYSDHLPVLLVVRKQ